jgi:dihydrofolate reductase/thymidylate synthase
VEVLPEGVLLRESLDDALETLASEEHQVNVERVFVIGGAQVYAEALASPKVLRRASHRGDPPRVRA